MDAIAAFLDSEKVSLLERLIHETAYITLGGDGLFVHVAKMAYEKKLPILGLNFWNRWFLVHDPRILDLSDVDVTEEEYPLLHVTGTAQERQMEWLAFNEVYITRSGDASTITLSLSHSHTTLAEAYRWDGLMISTPAGSTGWSRSYGGIILPHWAGRNVITPIGKIPEWNFHPMTVPEKWRIRITNDTSREAPIDVLVDNRRILSMETGTFELVIEQAEEKLRVLLLFQREKESLLL